MASKHDGVQAPLPPSASGLLYGVAVVGLGVALSVFVHPCLGAPAVLVGLLMLLNQARGKHRVRITHSKLLVEDERLVWGFLIGPSKSRVMWADFAAAELGDAELVVKDKAGGVLRVGRGCTVPELTELKTRVEQAAQRFLDDPDSGA